MSVITANSNAKAPPPPTKRATSSPASDWRPHPLMALYRDNQVLVPAVILSLACLSALLSPTLPALLPLAHLVMPYRHATSPSASGLYAKGPADLAFILGGVLFWTLARALTIDYLLKPLGKRLGCRRSLIDRFGEQGWLVIYYSLSFSIGLSFARAAPYWRNTMHFWTNYPHAHLAGDFKVYYLAQLAFWIQQLLVIHIEKPRKDYVQMLVHHIVTCALIVGSYVSNFTRMGTAVLVTMDVGDIFLSSAKCFNYVNWRTICDATFVVFVGVWLYSRHYIYYFLIRSVYVEAPKYLEWRWAPSEGRFVSDAMWYFFLALLGVLQVLLIIWLYMILRVIAKVVKGSSAEDTRSDDEDEVDVDEDDQQQQQQQEDDGPKKVSGVHKSSPKSGPARKRRA
ncbi:TLC domain-domain-containing protein [Catenaria anguillulae PL171]|uniref:TLC domain-domain-containing protein n=1 Tax=Catenaria anguillulae PL171 TaxID=765915 RepID=A0A1Y2H5A0_9FUNG|nr:TLC domain-domain-containing protein [Catenaria anguillulae PL171]